MNGTLELVDGPSGLRAGPFPATLGTTLAIGDTESVTIVLDAVLPNGPWDVRITLRSGLLVRDARATITFPSIGVAPPVHTDPIRPGWLSPAVLVVLVLGTAGLVLRKRRLRTSAARRAATPADRTTPSSAGVGKPVGLVR